MIVQPFNAQAPGIGYAITNTASSSTAMPGQGAVANFVNEGPGACFVSVGPGTQTAAIADGTIRGTSRIIQAGENVCYSIPADRAYNWSAISRTTSQLNIYVGEGQ